MGYVLPVQTSQQQYANRVEMAHNRYIPIGSVPPVNKLHLNFQAEMNKFNTPVSEQKESDQEEHTEKVMSSSYRGFIQPNPSNLSPAIANVVGKGMSVNTYA